MKAGQTVTRISRCRWISRLFIIGAICSLLGMRPALAQTGLTIDGIVLQNANLRAGPRPTEPVIGAAYAGQLVTVTDFAGAWYQLITGEWIAKQLVTATPDSRVVAFRLEDAPAMANRPANLRKGPGTSYAIVGHVQTGQRLQIVGQDQNNQWFKLSNDTWIAAFLVNRVEVGLPVINVSRHYSDLMIEIGYTCDTGKESQVDEQGTISRYKEKRTRVRCMDKSNG